jgi:hypothetical protein
MLVMLQAVVYVTLESLQSKNIERADEMEAASEQLP